MPLFQSLCLDFLIRYFPHLYDSIHLDFLRGHLLLRDVRIPSSNPFAPLCFYPFAVQSGSLALLDLHIPWASLTTSSVRLSVRSLHLHLAEPAQGEQDGALRALAKYVRARKHAAVLAADEQEGRTSLVRALYKLLPLLFHNVELDLQDIRITVTFSMRYSVTLALNSLTTHSSPTSNADLAKTFRLCGLTITVEDESFGGDVASPLCVSVPDAQVTLAMADAFYDVSVSLSSTVHVDADLKSLARARRRLEGRHRRWLLAFQYNRPNSAVSEAPLMWWRYAARVVTGRNVVEARALSVEHVRVVFGRCVRYHALLVKGMRGEVLSKAEASECAKVEGELTVEIARVLRERARVSVAVGKVVAVVAEDSWLQWVFGGWWGAARRGGVESSVEFAKEVQAALATVEGKHGGGEEGLNDGSYSWRKVRLSLHLTKLCGSLTDAAGDGRVDGDGTVRICVAGLIVQVEVESSLASFSVSVGVEDMSVFYGTYCVMRRGDVLNGVTEGKGISGNWVDVRAHKIAFEENVSVSLRLDPTLLVLDLCGVGRLLQYCNEVFGPKKLPSYGFCDTLNVEHALFERGGNIRRDTESVLFSVAVAVSQLDVLIARLVRKSDNGLDSHGVVVRCRDLDVHCEPNERAFDLHGHTVVSISSCNVKTCPDPSGMILVQQDSVCVDEGVTLRVCNVEVRDSTAGFSALVDEVTLTERKYGGKVSITPVKSMRHRAAVKVHRTLSSEPPTIEFTLGELAVTSSLESIAEVCLLSGRVTAMCNAFTENSQIGMGLEEEESTLPRFSLLVSNAIVNLVSPHGLSASFKQCYVVAQDTSLNVSCDEMDVKDISGHSPRSIVWTETPNILSDASPAERCLSFNFGPGLVNVYWNRIHVTIVRSVVDSIHQLTKQWQLAFSDQAGKERLISNTCCDDLSRSERSGLRITMHGSTSSVELAEEPSQHNRVRLDISHVIAAFSPSSQVVSLRKLTILTKSKRVNRRFITEDIREANPWAVLTRNMDIDISHHCANIIPSGDDCSVGYKNTFSASILSRVVVFLAPSQVHTFVNVLTQLFRTDSVPNVKSPSSVRCDLSLPSHDQTDSLTAFAKPSRKSVSHVSLQCETHALSIELVSETVDGVVSATIALVELDPTSFTLKVANESIGSLVLTSVVKYTARCPSFRIEDRDPKTAPSRQVVIETEESWLGLFGTAGRAPQQDVGIGLAVEGVSRTENGRTTSSHQVEVKHSRVVLSSRLYAAVTAFVNQCIWQGVGEDPIASKMPGDLVVESDENTWSTDVLTKVSVHLIEPVILLFSTDPALDDRVLEARTKSAKASLLISDRGELLLGSVLKFKDLQFFLHFMPNTIMQNMLTSMQGGGPVALSAIRENSLYSNSEPESLLLVKVATVRLPIKDQEYFHISVPDAVIESSLATVSKTLLLLSTIDVGAPAAVDGGVFCPQLKICVTSLIAKVKVPTTMDTSSLYVSRHNFVLLGLDISTEVVVAKNVEMVSGRIQVAADVCDERRKVCDHLLSPTPVHFEARMMDQVSVDIWTEKFIRITLSPLTAQTLTGIAILFAGVGGKCSGIDQDEVSSSCEEFGRYTGGATTSAVGVRMSFKGVFVCCVAEEPRMQLLKLVLRQLEVGAIVPMMANEEGVVEFSLQDVLLEDSMSWRLPVKEGERGGEQRWTRLIAGLHEERSVGDLHLFPTLFQRVMSNVREASVRMSRMEGGDASQFEGSGMDRGKGRVMDGRALQLVSCVVTWVSPMEQVTAQVRIKGLEFNVDLAVLSDVIMWVQRVWEEVEKVKACSPSFHSSGRRGREKGDVLNMRVDHVVVEPVNIRISIRAPGRGAEASLLERVLGRVMNVESVDGVDVQLPRVMFNGDFFGVDEVVERVMALYLRALRSRHVVGQVVWQLGRLVRFGGVVGVCLLRGAGEGVIKDGEESGRDGVGLLGLCAGPKNGQRGIVTAWSWEGKEGIGAGAGVGIETINITR